MSKTGKDVYRITFVKLRSRSGGAFSRAISAEKLDDNEPDLVGKTQLEVIDSHNYTPYRMGITSKVYDPLEDVKEEEKGLQETPMDITEDPFKVFYVPASRTMHTINCLPEEHILLPSQFDVTNKDNIITSAELVTFTRNDRKESVEMKYIPHYGNLIGTNGNNQSYYKGYYWLQMFHSQSPWRMRKARRLYADTTDTNLFWNIRFNLLSSGDVGMKAFVEYPGIPDPANKPSEDDMRQQTIKMINAMGANLYKNLGLNLMELKSFEAETKIPARVRSFSIKTTNLPTEIMEILSSPQSVIGDVGFYVAREGVDPFVKDDLDNLILDPTKVHEYGYLLASNEPDEGNFTFQGTRSILTKPPTLLVNRAISEEDDDPWTDPEDDDGDDGGGDDGGGDGDTDTLKRLIANFTKEASDQRNWQIPDDITIPGATIIRPQLVAPYQVTKGITFWTDLETLPNTEFRMAQFDPIDNTLKNGKYIITFDLYLIEFNPYVGSTAGSKDVWIAFGDWWTGTKAKIQRHYIETPANAVNNDQSSVYKVSFSLDKTDALSRFGFVVSFGIAHRVRLRLTNFSIEVSSLSGGGGGGGGDDKKRKPLPLPKDDR